VLAKLGLSGAGLSLCRGRRIAIHFTLQRVFVWINHEEFALRIHQQLGRYLAIVAMQYATTAVATRFLPRTLGLSVTLVYIITTILVAAANFLVFRVRIFHPRAESPLPE
jgi:hypothetical protein